MDSKIVYFHKVDGYFRYGNKRGEAIHWRNGVYQTDNALLLAEFYKDLKSGGAYVAAIRDAEEKPAPAEPPAETPAPKFCSRCRVNVEAADWVEHVAGHGRNKKHA